MTEEPSSAGGVPEWVVTFGDMMSLLLTFFIMLVSFSELKSEEKYQALLDAFHQQFGFHKSVNNLVPGELRPRNSALAKLASLARAKRRDTKKGGANVQAPSGDNELPTMVRPGKQTGVGIVLYFQENQLELDDGQREQLRRQAVQIQGKPQKIEIRGHASRRPVTPSTNVRDHWDMGYERCRHVMEFLVRDLDMDPRRIRIATAAAHEPQHLGTDAQKMRLNTRVEVYVLDEVVSDTTGTEDEQQDRFRSEPAPKPPAAAAPAAKDS
ncbi:MAG: flagellar motor protein MotB [Pirellulaceae bacterium]